MLPVCAQALFGSGFITSCRDAFQLIARNVVSLSAITILSNFFSFLGKLFVVATTCLCTYLMVNATHPDDSVDGVNPVVPTVVAGILAYAIASVFLQV